MSTALPAPEGEVAKRVLHFFWIADDSGSMSGKKIATLNQAIREVLPDITKAVATQATVRVVMRAIRFSVGASWHVGPNPVPLEQFSWPELTAEGGATETAKAIRLLASELELEKMPRRGLPPVCILLSDGHHTDRQEEYDAAINELKALPWGVHAVRLAIGIGSDESAYDERELLKFVSHDNVGVLKAHSPQELVQYIKWASTEATRSASQGKSKLAGEGGDNLHVALPTPPAVVTATTAATEGF
jgi:uncharacterized protein YegL